MILLCNSVINSHFEVNHHLHGKCCARWYNALLLTVCYVCVGWKLQKRPDCRVYDILFSILAVRSVLYMVEFGNLILYMYMYHVIFLCICHRIFGKMLVLNLYMAALIWIVILVIHYKFSFYNWPIYLYLSIYIILI